MSGSLPRQLACSTLLVFQQCPKIKIRLPIIQIILGHFLVRPDCVLKLFNSVLEEIHLSHFAATQCCGISGGTVDVQTVVP